jgi:hypothetical protein
MQGIIAELSKAGQQRAATVLRDALDTPWDEAGMAGAFDTMRDWSVAHDRPVIVNEFGALSHVAPRGARLEWLAAVRRQAEKRCIGWTHWDFQDGFGLIDSETGMPDAGIMQALTPDADYGARRRASGRRPVEEDLGHDDPSILMLEKRQRVVKMHAEPDVLDLDRGNVANDGHGVDDVPWRRVRRVHRLVDRGDEAVPAVPLQPSAVVADDG